MMFVGIDQHKRHLTICVRNDQGQIMLRRQVKTRWEQTDCFLEHLRQLSAGRGGYVAVIEVCGFNDWLIERLKQWGCTRVLLIKPPGRVRQKTDRRDAAKLSELLWMNRDRMAAGERLLSVSEVYQPTAAEQHDRRLTHLRHKLGRRLGQAKNAMQHVLRRHNLEQERPTKGAFTQASVRWMHQVSLPGVDRLELDMWLQQYGLLVLQMKEVNRQIGARAQRNKNVALLRTAVKMGDYSALAIRAHIGPIERVPKAQSLANFFGVTPGCRNSGEAERRGRITKAGHPFIRFLMGQLVLHALRSDAGLRKWYQGVKRRRGAKIARVAVMRRLCETVWHVLKSQEAYQPVSLLQQTAV